ncbi:hypothetical protein MTQ02_00185 [Chryseobacterium rhizosphaerae]|nr:hypothetical protein [Chryseobacterium rhizosphaerae]GEN67603.1 hypothetical protein CRH01_21710 [Chryseobacterium rhizosphaerae]
MSHLNTGASFFGPGTYKNYKYNGKELQETEMYDYGARMYMADIGRWGVLDNYSEKYNSLSPYNYVAGNPIRYIDINGEWIYINDQDGTQYRYHNGATQHQVEGKWTNINSSTHLSDYVLQTVAGLNYLDKNTSIGNTMINYFDQAQGNDGKVRDINFNYTNGASQVKYGESNIVELNSSDRKGVWTTAGNDGKSPSLYATIAHEMGHVYGNFALGHIAQNCIPNTEGRLIDNAGSSIYYNSDGTQINPIPSVKNVLDVNNTVLKNRYNYHGAAAFYHWQKLKNRAY